MEIDVDKAKNVLIRILIIVVVVAAVWLTRGVWMAWFENEPDNNESWAAVQTAAEEFATAFYTVDYRDQLDWQQRLETTCSDMGWGLMTEFMPQIWQLIVDARLVSTVTSVEVGEPVTAGQTPVGGIPYVVVPVSVEKDTPWPAAEGDGPTTFYAIMELVGVTEENSEIWKFRMFMPDEDVAKAKDAAAEATSQPVPTMEDNQ